MWEGMEITMFWEPVLLSVVWCQKMQAQPQWQNNVPVIKAAVSFVQTLNVDFGFRVIYKEACLY